MPAPTQWRAFSAYYGAPVAEFLATSPAAVIGRLAMADTLGRHEKAIVFVTGVPGAGKLQEALTRDEYRRLNGAERKGAIKQRVKPFVQNVHHFRDEGVRSDAPPFDHVVIFDEAQRAWNREKTADFMKRKKGHAGFAQSESEFLISYLDRHQSWAVIVCLVGGGQGIHTGEAGIGAWLEAVRCAFPTWRTYVSPDLSGSEYAATRFIESLEGVVPLERDGRLHLSTGSWGSRRIHARATTSRTRRRSSRSSGSVVRRKLDFLHRARSLGDLRLPSGDRLEALKGDRAGRCSLRVNDQYRITFRFEDGHAHDVSCEDYQ